MLYGERGCKDGFGRDELSGQHVTPSFKPAPKQTVFAGQQAPFCRCEAPSQIMVSLGQLLADNATPPKKDERGHSENLGAAATRFGNNWNVSSESVGAAARTMEVRAINLVKGDIFARFSFETAGVENEL